MELVKVNESVNRSYEGEIATEEVTSVIYNIVDNDSVIGSASISNGSLSIGAQILGTMDEIKTKVEAMFE